jgi:hypothetical protein
VDKKAPAVLRMVLLNSRTAIPLLLFIAQIRTNILCGSSDEVAGSRSKGEQQLKLIAHLFDTSQEVLMQFTDFLVTAALPSLNSDGAAVASNKVIENIASLM